MPPIRLALVLVLTSLSCAARAEPATAPVSLFDPARHMRVAEVRAGMKGYGLSVFEGTRIDRFEVEVVSVLHNFNPQYDVVLIRCHGANLEHTGPVAGMSGSPVYLTDDQGHDRLIGAFAYGWSQMKDPVAGVQPIEYMLEIGSKLHPEAAATQPAGQNAGKSGSSAGTRLIQIDPVRLTEVRQVSNAHSGRNPIQLLGNGDATQLRPLATPLMAAGLSQRLMEQLAPAFREYGLVSLQSGGLGGSATATTQPTERMAPGAVMAAPLVSGDVELTAIGTCTEVLGDRTFGFGHPFNNEGPITLPMGAGRINGIIASLSQSFKIGSITQVQGTLIADQAVGVAGMLGKAPPTIPIDIRVIYTDGSMDVKYHFEAAAHPRLTPTLTATAVAAALGGRRDLPQYHTVNYDLSLQFANGQTVAMKDTVVNVAEPALFSHLVAPITLAADNDFERVMLKQVTGTIRVTPDAHDADILSVTLAKTKYRPGETLKAFIRYRPFRQAEATMPVELPLPHDLRDGKYRLSICDQETYLQQEQAARPFRFSAESIDDVFAVIKDVLSVRSDAVYVQLLRQTDGVAVGRTALPLLPSSRRQVLLDGGRSDVTPFLSTTIKVIPTEIVMSGSENFEIEIDSQDRVEVGGARSTRPETRAPIVLPGETGKPKPAPPAADPPELP